MRSLQVIAVVGSLLACPAGAEPGPLDVGGGLASERLGAASDGADGLGQRAVAAAVVALPTMLAGVLAAYIFPLGLGIAVAPVIAVLLPATTAAVASLFVVPWYWSWFPALSAFGGTLVGGIAGVVAGLVLVNVVPPSAGPLDEEANVFFLLPAIALGTALGSGLAAGAAAAIVGGPIREAE
jgi:hypothetical protein